MKMRRFVSVTGLLSMILLLNTLPASAQGMAGRIESLHTVLDQLYTEMLPLCQRMIGIGQAIAAFAALWYIGSRVWKHIAAAEAIDFYPLLRPFAIGLCIVMFPTVISVINGVLQPTVEGTKAMVKDSNKAIERLLKMKEDAMRQTKYWQMYVGEDGKGDKDAWMKYAEKDEDQGLFGGISTSIEFTMSKAYYNMKNTIRHFISVVLEVLYQAAALCVNTMRTFNLIVLVILGPLVFGLAVFDGFQHTLTIWLARYINVFLWLPVANIFGAIIAKIQENMLKLDISQVQSTGDTFFSEADIAYLIFMVIAIVGYTTVPNVADHIVNAGGASVLTRKVSSMVGVGAGMAAGAAGAVVNGGSMLLDGVGNTMMNAGGNMSAAASSGPYFNGGNGGGGGSGHQAGRIKGD